MVQGSSASRYLIMIQDLIGKMVKKRRTPHAIEIDINHHMRVVKDNLRRI